MKATSQIEAMQLMAIDPVQRIALPRFAAGVLSLPLLTAMFNAMAILGSVVFAIGVMGDEDRRLDAHVLRLHVRDEGIEIVLCRADIRVTAYENGRHVFRHCFIPSFVHHGP